MAENLPDTNVGNIEYISKADSIDDLHTQLMYRMGSDDMKRRLDDWVKTLPSADVVQVCRCKDCEWAVKSTELPGWYMCKCEEAFDYYAKPDDFCSYGKRREE